MSRLLLLLILFLSLNAFSQSPQGKPSYFSNKWYQMPFVGADSSFILSRTDTNWTPRFAGSTTYWLHAGVDTALWIYNGNRWIKQSSSSYVSIDELSDSLAKYVTLNTPQTLGASGAKIFTADQIFDGKVGIGTTPAVDFDVVSGTGRMAFDGERITLYDDENNNNLLLGVGTAAGDNITVNNIAIGGSALRNVTAANSIGIGTGVLSSSGTANRNTGVGIRALQLSNGNDNTAVGYQAAVTTFGDSNTVIGSEASAAKKINETDISNTEIVLGTNTYSGSQVAAWITANSLTIGQRYPVFIVFNGTLPSPFTTNTNYANAQIQDASTVQLNISLFNTKGTGTTTFNLYNKQQNSIAIGYGALSPSSNTTMIGNSNTNMTYLGGGALDIPVSSTPTPSSGHAVLWFDGTNVKLTKNVGGTTTTATIF